MPFDQRDNTPLKTEELLMENFAQTLAQQQAQRRLAETMTERCLALTAQTSYKTVLDEILHQVEDIIDHDGINIMLWTADQLGLVRWHGYQNLTQAKLVAVLERSLITFSVQAEVIQEGRPFIIVDTHQDSRWCVVEDGAWLRSFMAIPLSLSDRVLGLLRLDSRMPGQFSTHDAEYLKPLANAAAIALRNARLYDQAQLEIAERVIQAETEIIELNRKLLNLHYLGTTVTPSYDLQQAFDTLIDEIFNLLQVDGCAIYKWDKLNAIISLVAKQGLSDYWERGLLNTRYQLVDFPLINRVLVEQRPQQITNDHRGIYPAELVYLQQSQLKTLLMVPIEFQDCVIGLVKIMCNQADRTFTNREIALVQLLTNQAIGIIENMRLYDQAQQEIVTRRQKEQELRQVIAHNQAVLEAIPNSIFYFSHTGALLDYKLATDSNLPPEILGEVATGKHLSEMFTPDLANLMLPHIDKALTTGVMQVFEYQLPLPQGIQEFEAQVAVSDPHEVLVMMHNITARKMRAANFEKEQARVTRNLHEGLGQSLAYLHLKLDQWVNENPICNPEELQQDLIQLRNVTSDAYEQVRRLLAAARALNSTDLGTALLVQARAMGQQADFKVQLTSEGRSRPLSPIVQQQILYIFQEGLSNIVKHAGADQVKLKLLWQEDELMISLSDDGQGFELDSLQTGSHFGLTIMQQRAKEINGQLTIRSEQKKGAELTLWLPVQLAA